MFEFEVTPFLPVELVFNPNWWNKTAGISFERPFYFSPRVRMENDVTMRRVYYQRYGQMGLGEADPQPRPVIGSMFVAGGFLIPALLGAEIRFSPNEAPQPLPVSLSMEQLERFERPDFLSMWPMDELAAGWNAQEVEFGYLVGDLNTDGLLNAAYHLYGQDLFADFYSAPERVSRLLEEIATLITQVALYIRQRSGSSSISVNRMAAHLTPSPFLHANCSVQMISPNSYRAMQLPIEQRMAQILQPYGIHHCGEKLHLYAADYAQVPVQYCEVGWGANVALCRKALPDAFLNLRLSPIRMLQCTPAEIAQDTEQLLSAAGPLEKVGLCCINMDDGTPDDNLFAMYSVVERYRRYGA